MYPQGCLLHVQDCSLPSSIITALLPHMPSTPCGDHVHHLHLLLARSAAFLYMEFSYQLAHHVSASPYRYWVSACFPVFSKDSFALRLLTVCSSADRARHTFMYHNFTAVEKCLVYFLCLSHMSHVCLLYKQTWAVHCVGLPLCYLHCLDAVPPCFPTPIPLSPQTSLVSLRNRTDNVQPFSSDCHSQNPWPYWYYLVALATCQVEHHR